MKIHHITAFCILSLLLGADSWAQSGLQTGIVGRIQIDPAVSNAEVWEVSKGRLLKQRSSARIRRNSGHGPLRPSYETAPPFQVLLEGARSQEKRPIMTLHYVGKTLEPSQLLVIQSLRVRLTNKEIYPITPIEIIENAKEIPHERIEPGGSRIIELSENAVALSSTEHPYSSTTIRVLLKARPLEPQQGGFVPRIFLESGDYNLVFFHGVKEVFRQPVAVPDNGFVAFDAVVARDLKVNVTLKDGALQVVRQPPRPTRATQQLPQNEAGNASQSPNPAPEPTRGVTGQPGETP